MTKPKPKDQHKKPGRQPKTANSGKAAPISGAIQGQQVQAKIGRPKALTLDDALLKQIDICGRAQMSLSEAAGILGVARNTFETFLKENPEAQAAWTAAPCSGKGVIKLAQYKKAASGSVDALKWWGKQHLGQAEKTDQNNTGQPGVVVVAPPLTEEDHARIARNVAGLLG